MILSGELVEWHIQSGTNGIVPCGTTGESPTLSHQEHDAVVTTVVEAVNKRVPVLAGCGSNATAETLRLVKHAQDVGADLHHGDGVAVDLGDDLTVGPPAHPDRRGAQVGLDLGVVVVPADQPLFNNEPNCLDSSLSFLLSSKVDILNICT